MNRKVAWFTAGAVALFLLSSIPLWAISAATAYINPEYQYLSIEKEGWQRTDDEASFKFTVDKDFEYLIVLIGLGGCCPQREPDESVIGSLKGPTEQTYGPWEAQTGECHFGDPTNCRDRRAWGVAPNGQDWIVIVQPPKGQYEMVIKPGANTEKLPRNGNFGGAASGMFEKANAETLLGNNIMWYYPDGTSKFVNDGGYVTASEAIDRAIGFGLLVLLMWGGAAFLYYWPRRSTITDWPVSEAPSDPET